MSAGYLAKCAGKVRHETKELALAARRSQVATGHWRMNNTNTYKCTQCGGYHNGHMGRSNRGRK